MTQVYAPWGMGDVAISTTLIPYLEPPIKWIVNAKNAFLLEGHGFEIVTLENILTNDKVKYPNHICPLPWQNMGLLGNPYAYIPQLAVLNEIKNRNPRPILKFQVEEYKRTSDKPLCLLESKAVSFDSMTDEEINRITTLLPNHEIVNVENVELKQIPHAYVMADVFIGISSGISCVCCAYQCPRVRIEYQRGDKLSCIYMEPNILRCTTSDELFRRIRGSV